MNKESKGNKFKKYIKYVAIGLVTGAANGLFGSGGGTIAVPAMVHFLGAEEHKAHATAISVILPLTVVSSVFYISKGYADWGLTLKVTLGGLIGGYIGARLLNVCPEKWLRRIFAIFMAAAGIRMIL
ncbi:MAG TPA: sulfite exporter TauE/SafE family protein [Clostridia bacterium]|nr:sulfite exporter TauE/SafE family protein [Clostridia bacterium]